MSEQLYKAIIGYKAARIGDMGFGGPFDARMARLLNSEASLKRMGDVLEWLAVNERNDHYVNIYDNTDDDVGRGQLVVVLSDRDTALMLKLALG